MRQLFSQKLRITLGALGLGAGIWLVLALVAAAAPPAALFLNPTAGSFLVGSTFELSIILDTKGVPVNTVEVELSFPADKLQIASPSVGRSIIQLWPASPVFSNREGRIYFVGGIPSPGIVTSQGVVLTLTFRVVAPGAIELRFRERTRVLANDGRGTNILGQRPSAFFTARVAPPEGPPISSPTNPDQERWYRDSNPVFLWPRSQFADAYSFTIDHDPTAVPDTRPDGTSPTAAFQNLESGIWYFHLRERAGGVWGGVSHYVVKIDTEPPAVFRLNVSPGPRTSNKNPIFRFFTTDALSGFSHFEMKIVPLTRGSVSEALFFEVTSPYQAPNFEAGRYQVVVRAGDHAGNARDETVTMHILGAFSQFIDPEGINFVWFFLPWSWVTLAVGIILAVILAVLVAFWRRHRHHLGQAIREDFRGAVGTWRNMRSGVSTKKLESRNRI